MQISNDLSNRLGKFEKHLLDKGFGPQSLRLYDKSLHLFFGLIQISPEEILASDVLAWVQLRLKAGGKPSGVWASLYHVRNYYAWEGLVWPGRGVRPKRLALGEMPEGLPEPDPEWDD